MDPSPKKRPVEAAHNNLLKLEDFLDIHYPVDLLVGEALLTVGEILKLEKGDVVKLDRLASEALQLRVAEVPIAAAEVTLDERGTAIHVTDLQRRQKSRIGSHKDGE